MVTFQCLVYVLGCYKRRELEEERERDGRVPQRLQRQLQQQQSSSKSWREGGPVVTIGLLGVMLQLWSLSSLDWSIEGEERSPLPPEAASRIGLCPSWGSAAFPVVVLAWTLDAQLLNDEHRGEKTVEGETAAKILLPLLCSWSTSRAFKTPALPWYLIN